MEEKQGVGIPWYDRAEYEALRTLLGDPDSMPAAYEEWLVKVNEIIKRSEGLGWIVIKVPIHPNELISWCRSKNLVLDYKAQNFFASEFAKSQFYDRN